ncbi:MAG: NfeD family protein [Thermoplasmata archaeon]|nr:NfeD family protein [Thermoplasmata archaeon]
MIISFYLVVAIICAVMLIIMAAFADFGGDAGFDGVDMHLDTGADAGFGDFHGAGISPLSIPIILVFGTLFGAFGAVFEDMEMNTILVPTLSALIGVAITAVIFVLLVKVFVKSQATTQVHIKDLVGSDGETTMPIKPGSPGQIMVITEERGRTLVSAVSEVDIPTNAMVNIVGIAGNGVKVVPKNGGE